MDESDVAAGLAGMLALFAMAIAPMTLVVCMAARAAFGSGGSARAAGLAVLFVLVLLVDFVISLNGPGAGFFGALLGGGLAGAALVCWAVSAVLPGHWRRTLDVAVLCSLGLAGVAWLALA